MACVKRQQFYQLSFQMKKLEWCQKQDHESPIIKVPLQFTFPPVQILMKELTKLNSPHPYRIVYLGPRWDNSVLFHKKYSNGGAYEFKERKLSKSAGLLHDSMIHNQFYKNQIYYRAFEGMNPTINLENELIFQSRFQGGNLDCAVKINENEYDLFLRIDSNTQGHIFWFYFSVKNMKKGKKIKFNLANLTKNDTHYTKGLNPYMFSSKTNEWTQESMSNVTFRQKKLRYQFLYQKLRIRNFYELSFEVEADGSEQMKFAYCIPYGYSDLLKDIKEISAFAQIGSLGQTLTGVNIPMIMVGNHEQNVSKPVILITGRVHPGQSNSSIIISNFMKYICHHPQARHLREKVLTIIVPMTNPDGVILGNSRCGASGKDLNRQFKTNSKALYPQIVLLKNLVDKISQTHDIDIYLDFHGHSRKKNMFIFGPSYNITQPQYYKCRIFPKLLSNFTSTFRYYSCSYDIPYQKRSTARAVMLNQCLIPFVYTVETSLGFYHDYNLHKDMVFTRKKWQELGQSVVLALKEYYEGIEQYELYIQSKKKAKKLISEQIRSINTAVSQNNAQIVISMKKSVKQPRKQLKDIKFIKLFEEIKELQQIRGKQQKKEKDSDNESDSHDQKQQLQKEKMHQFSGMVTYFVQTETRIQLNQAQKVYFSSKKKDKNEKKAKTKQQRRLEREQRFKEQENILKDLSQQKKVIAKRFQVKSESKNRYRFKEQQKSIGNLKKDRTQIISQQIKKQSNPYKEINLKQRQKRMILHHYLEQQVDFVSVEKKNNKTNVRMFNFSKMVQNPKSLRYHDHKQYIRVKDLSHNYLEKSTDYKKAHQYYSQFSNYSQNEDLNAGKSTFINLQNMIEGNQSETYRRFSQKDSTSIKNSEDLKPVKGRNGFPSSFYRIKYHNNQRKKLEHRKEKLLHEFEEFKKINQYNTQNNLNNYAGVVQGQIDQQQQLQTQQGRSDGLFLKVKKFPVF